MSFWTPENLRQSAGGSWLARPADLLPEPASLIGLSIDSRAVRPGQLFVAVRGDRFDGHDFLAQAVERGAAMLMVERSDALPPALAGRLHIAAVPDTRKALLRLAAAYRQSLANTKVIAVVGSNGKTTTTRLIHAVLSRVLRGTASAKSFNNAIGVPLTILSARPADQFLICEVGSNAPGEIATLAAIVQPDVAVIVSIGREHLEGFGSLAGVAREESAIVSGLRPGGIVIATADSPDLAPLLAGVPGLLSFGLADHADLRLTDFAHVGAGETLAGEFEVNGRARFRVSLPGRHNALNALAALAVGRRFGLPDADLAAGLATATAPDMRLQRTIIGGMLVVNDAYNANPESTLAALETFRDLAASSTRRVVILGDHLELGPAGPALHADLGRAIAALGSVDLLITVGPLAAQAGESARAAGLHAATAFPGLDGGIDATIAARLAPGDAVLIKGSRGMRLERIVTAIQSSHAPAPAGGMGDALLAL